MKKTLTVILIIVTLTTPVQAASRVRGYYRKSGGYVAPHYRTKADGRRYNNFSAKGNFNPYTGEKGYTPLIK